jgi:hypothetical protein
LRHDAHDVAERRDRPRVERRSAQVDHGSECCFEAVAIHRRRRVHEPSERLPKRSGQGERREPRASPVRPRDAHGLRERQRRQRADNETGREERRQCNLTFAAERGTPNESGERAEPKARSLQCVRRKDGHGG